MQNSVKPWQWAIAAALLLTLGVGLWRLNASPRTPVITADIPRGATADEALKIKMD